MTKKCFKCAMNKPITDFYKHPNMADGHFNKCKECARIDVNTNRTNNVERYREYDRVRFQNDPKRRVGVFERASRLRQENPGLRASYLRASIKRAPEKRRAQVAVGNAIRDKRLVKQPCECCGTSKAQAHHEDYSRPLDVTWLCTLHHGERHRDIRDKARASVPF